MNNNKDVHVEVKLINDEDTNKLTCPIIEIAKIEEI